MLMCSPPYVMRIRYQTTKYLTRKGTLQRHGHPRTTQRRAGHILDSSCQRSKYINGIDKLANKREENQNVERFQIRRSRSQMNARLSRTLFQSADRLPAVNPFHPCLHRSRGRNCSHVRRCTWWPVATSNIKLAGSLQGPHCSTPGCTIHTIFLDIPISSCPVALDIGYYGCCVALQRQLNTSVNLTR